MSSESSVDGNSIRGDDDPTNSSTSPSSLPGYLPWEHDLQMVSRYMDTKVRLASDIIGTLRTHLFIRVILVMWLVASEMSIVVI